MRSTFKASSDPSLFEVSLNQRYVVPSSPKSNPVHNSFLTCSTSFTDRSPCSHYGLISSPVRAKRNPRPSWLDRCKCSVRSCQPVLIPVRRFQLCKLWSSSWRASWTSILTQSVRKRTAKWCPTAPRPNTSVRRSKYGSSVRNIRPSCFM